METDSRPAGSDSPVILQRGFRVFFLGAAVWAALAMAVYMASLSGLQVIAPSFSIINWHVHEFLFGYTGAVIAGFLLTAVPNWTRRPPIAGLRLLFLFAVWVAGRLAIAWSGYLGTGAVATIDLAFPAFLIVFIARELVAAGNYRNFRVLALLALFMAADATFLYEAALAGTGAYAVRAGLAVVLTLIMLIGGRIIPAFTRNWMAQHHETALPEPFGRYDGLTIGVSALALALWTIGPYGAPAAWTLAFAGLLNIGRLARWHGGHVLSEGLVAILHVAYAFIPLGLLAMALSIYDLFLMPAGAATHLLTAGSIGMMTMAVMTRTSLGHTGQKLHADRTILAIYLSLAASVFTRFAYALEPGYTLLMASAGLWILAFVLFVVRFGSMAKR